MSHGRGSRYSVPAKRSGSAQGVGPRTVNMEGQLLKAQTGHLSKRMSDHYKHISEGAARKAAEELARVKAEQRAEARAKLNHGFQAESATQKDAAGVLPDQLYRGESAVPRKSQILRSARKTASVRSSVHPVGRTPDDAVYS